MNFEKRSIEKWKMKFVIAIMKLQKPVLKFKNKKIKIKYGVCFGTKECEECNCKGDTSKCDFYSEKRKQQTKTEKTITKAEAEKILGCRIEG